MRKTLTALLASLALIAAMAGSAFAHDAGPCSGEARDYAAHHVVALARAGMLGAAGHNPGDHQGYSVCLAVHE